MDFKKLLSLQHLLSVLCSKRRVISGLGAAVLGSLLIFSLLFSVCGKGGASTLASSPSSLLSWFFSVPGNGSDAQGSPGERGRVSEVARGEDLIGKGKDIWGKEVLRGSSERTTDGRSSSEAWGHGGRSSGNNTVEEGNGLKPGNITGVGNGGVSLNAGDLEKSGERGHAGKSSGKSTVDETNGPKHGGAGEVALDGNFTGFDNGTASVNGGVLDESSGGDLSVDLTDKNILGGKELLNGGNHMTNLTLQDSNSSLSVIGISEGKINVTDFLDGGRSGSLSNGKLKESDEAPISHQGSSPEVVSSGHQTKCDIFNGRWVRDENKPYYPLGSCPNIDLAFNCHANGRPDYEFLKWRWQPNDCDIPSLNATDFLRRLRGQRLIFVGDSLNRNMWESLVCILRHSVKKKKGVYEMSGRNQFKTAGYYSFRFEDYNCSVDFVRSPYLVRELYNNSVNGLEDEKLRLDVIDETTSAYREADIVVFNTGHWWTHEKTSAGINYYQEGDHVYPVLKVQEAYKKALSTWARWVDKNINPNKTQVVFRGYSLTHFSGGQWNSGGQCHKETKPIFNESFVGKYPVKMRALEQVLNEMKMPVIYLNISRLTDYRKDGHPSIYRKKYKSVEEQINAEKSPDCSHWCLPGVPDTWNELLYASLLMAGRGSWKN